MAMGLTWDTNRGPRGMLVETVVQTARYGDDMGYKSQNIGIATGAHRHLATGDGTSGTSGDATARYQSWGIGIEPVIGISLWGITSCTKSQGIGARIKEYRQLVHGAGKGYQ